MINELIDPLGPRLIFVRAEIFFSLFSLALRNSDGGSTRLGIFIFLERTRASFT